MDARIRKDERLKRRKVIQKVFDAGKSVHVYPLLIKWVITTRDGRYQARVGFTVSKKRFRRAVDRNLIKRRMREAYRLNKSILYVAPILDADQISAMLIYTAESILAFKEIENGMVAAMNRLVRKLNYNV